MVGDGAVRDVIEVPDSKRIPLSLGLARGIARLMLNTLTMANTKWGVIESTLMTFLFGRMPLAELRRVLRTDGYHSWYSHDQATALTRL